MKFKLRILPILLATLIAGSTLVGCANDPSADKETSAATNSTSNAGQSETQPETDPVKDALDAIKNDVDWGGEEFGILYVNDIAGYTEEVEAKEKADDSTSSAVINDAVYTRNTQFEDICKLSFALVPVSNSSMSTKLSSEAQTATGDFLLATQTTSGMAGSATSGFLYNYLDLNIDYDQIWWDEGTLEFALEGKVFFMNGPFNIVDDDVTFVMMFNKQLREDHKVANPYDTVKAGQWTLEYFNSVISNLSGDTNGDGKWDENDTYGFSTPGSIGKTFFYGAGLQYIKNNREMDAPELLLTGTQMEKALHVLELANTILNDNHSTYMAKQGDEALSKSVFMQGRSLFYCEAASYLRGLNAEMTTEYGVLPIPKYDEDQEHYSTWSHDIGSTLGIPTSVGKQDLEQFARVLEIYTLLSEMYVRPAYYDTMLTTRNVRDAESAEMVDLIFLHRTYDMAMYFGTLGLSDIFKPGVNGDTFASTYASTTKKFDQRIDRLLSKLRG